MSAENDRTIFPDGAFRMSMTPESRGPSRVKSPVVTNSPLELNLPASRERGDTPEFRGALLRTAIDEGLFLSTVGKVDFLGDRLFRATLAFPANVPTGTYSVEIFLLRNGEVVSAQTTPLVVSKIGVDAQVFDFADRQALAYGLIAVLIAVMAGWLASLPFRSA